MGKKLKKLEKGSYEARKRLMGLFFKGETYNNASAMYNAKISKCDEDLAEIEANEEAANNQKVAEDEAYDTICKIVENRKNNTAEKASSKKYTKFFDEENEYTCIQVDVSSLRDENYAKYKTSPKGKALLKRDLVASSLFIENEDGDLMKVNNIILVQKELPSILVQKELPSIEEVNLLFETSTEYYVISFKCTFDY